jgi:hypothetical protein
VATNLKSLFKGKETMKEETKEAKAVKSGKISPKQYVKGEKMEGESTKGKMKVAEKLKSGKMSPVAYAKSEMKKEKK